MWLSRGTFDRFLRPFSPRFFFVCSFSLGQCRDGDCCLCMYRDSSHSHNQTRPAVTVKRKGGCRGAVGVVVQCRREH